MRTTPMHPLAQDYLDRLDAAARTLPSQDRVELLAELHSHLEAGLGDRPSEADVRNLLRELGSPEDIVAAAHAEAGQGRGESARGGEPAGVRGPWGPVEVLAVLGLTVGALVLPLLGPLVGLVLAWVSPRWSRGEKVVATVLTAVPFVVLSLGVVAVGAGGSVDAVRVGP